MSTQPGIQAAARELVLSELAGKVAAHAFYTRVPQQPAGAEPGRIALHEQAAALYQALIKAAPQVWADQQRLARLAANAEQEDSDAV